MTEFYDKLETIFQHHYDYSFEPTLSFFKNGIVFNYKKCGTRFFRELASYPNSIHTDNKQFDVSFRKNSFTDIDSDLYKLNYDFKSFYLLTPFDNESLDPYVKNSFKYKNTLELLNDEGVNSFNELILENKNKDIIFVIRNPIKRFFSGLTQIIISFREKILTDDSELNLFKLTSTLSDKEIKVFVKNYNLHPRIEFQKVDDIDIIDTFVKVLFYILKYRWEYILQDIHTENYLRNYHELVSNIKNKSKIKIIDLDDCNTDSSVEFFSQLRGDDLLKPIWDSFLEKNQESNVFVYKRLLSNSKYLKELADIPIFSYLKNEQLAYLQLKESKYFIKI